MNSTGSCRGVSILIPDVSSNSIGAATMLGKALQKHYPVQIIGPDMGGGINAMYRGSFDYTTVAAPRIYRLPEFLPAGRRLLGKVSGNVVIAVKAYSNTVPLALWMKLRHQCKMVVYLDEWDGAVFRSLPAGKRILKRLMNLHHPMDESWQAAIERLIPRADAVISTTTFLQKKFGGHIVHYGIDGQFFRPRPPEQTAALKASLGLAGKQLVVFGGVVRPHKGIELILNALDILNNPSVALLVAGPETDHVKCLAATESGRRFLRCTGSIAKEEMPCYLGLADLIALPLKDDLLARSQMPCKVFEAMAMAKPIIATDVSDLRLALEGCGRIVPPDDAGALATAIESVLNDPEGSAVLGRDARKKCMESFSLEKTEEQLLGIISRLFE